MSSTNPRVVIIGGGFGGLECTRKLRKSPCQVTLIDRRNFHLFQPLLYQVATGGLSPGNIATPLRYIVRKQQNAEVVLGEVVDFDLSNQEVVLRDGRIPFDYLVLAAGSTTSYFGSDHWEKIAPGLKTVEDAADIRRRIFTAFERAERETDADRRKAWQTFVVIGGGPTGVELAGTLAEITRHTLTHDFRHVDPAKSRILLIEAGKHVLSHYPESLSQSAAKKISRMGIEVLAETRVTEIAAGYVRIQQGDKSETIFSETVIWAAGVKANPLASKLASAAGLETDRGGRVPVQTDLSLAGYPNVFAIGDLANCAGADGKPLPGVAPVAIQQGRFVAKRLITGKLQPAGSEGFRYRDPGTMATIGRGSAVAQVWGMKWKGFVAWVLWLFVHLMQIVQFQNRVLVLMQWTWNYFTYNRSARLITMSREESHGKVVTDSESEPIR